jgi:hypothetical protein
LVPFDEVRECLVPRPLTLRSVQGLAHEMCSGALGREQVLPELGRVGHDAPVPPTDTKAVDADPGRDERRAASLAVIAYWFCDVIGPPMVLWWARRHGSTFARRYAWTSLALNVPTLVGLVVWAATFRFLDGLALLGLMGALLLAGLVPGVVAIQLAVRAWRGEDVDHLLLPEGLIRRLPTHPALRRGAKKPTDPSSF